MRIDFVDLPHWDEDPIDFDAAAADGCLGAIFKVTENDDYVDPTYKSRRQAAGKAGLLTGGYHFLRPGNMERQVSWFLSNAAFDDLDRVCIDHEDEGVSLDDLKAFAQALRDQGVTNRIALYSGFLIKEQAPNKPDAEDRRRMPAGA
jgi:GH25 family lysozyme M1 (1,4-beta-N-acetylmuramidase)